MNPPAFFSNRTVRAGRRRPTSTPASERPQAEAPQRRRPTGGGSTGSPGGGLPLPSLGGKSPLSILLLVLVLACGIPLYILFGGGDSDQQEQPTEVGFATVAATSVAGASTEATPQPTRTPRPRPTNTAPIAAGGSTASGDTWTVMLYQDADDKVLEQDIYIDLNEAERAGSAGNVRLVAQVDRFKGGYSGDGNWTGTRRYEIGLDDDLSRVSSEMVDDLGEVNMSAGESLLDFVSWAAETYPADHYALILSDHGMGWPGGWSDPDPGGRAPRNFPLGSALGDQLYLMELDDTLAEIRAQTGIDQFELIGMDACLMGQVEVLAALAPHARVAVVSEETEPSLGWAYTSFLGDLNANPGMSGAELGQRIVDSYIQDDQRIVDDQARLEWVGRGSPLSSLYGAPTAGQVRQQIERGITLTAVDLEQVPALLERLNELSNALQAARQSGVAKARGYAQAYTSIFGSKVPPSYIDLGNFAKLLQKEANNPAVSAAAGDLLQAIDAAVIAEKHGPEKSGSTGISIYFPSSQLYGSAAAGPQSYTVAARRFAEQSLWDEFLAFHYTGQTFDPSEAQVAVPAAGSKVRGPGAAPIAISPITADRRTTSVGQPVLLSAEVSGENIGHIYFFTGFLDQSGRSIFIADQDYLTSSADKEAGGVTYPDWGQGDFTLEFAWEPLVFGISDGETTVNAALTPQSYGASPEEAVYTVDGTYTFLSGEQRPARLYFRDGRVTQVFGFTGNDFSGAPREITPTPGDTFTVLETWIDLDENGRPLEQVTQEGGTLTFGDSMFTWQELNPAPGPYILGFIVTDQDGNAEEAYTQVVVR
jgi:hypothetical protein